MIYAWLFILTAGNSAHQIVKDRVGKQTKVLRDLPTAEPNVKIRSLSDNPDSKDFLGFQIINTKTGKELFRFRAKDIVECRKFMASLGDTGDGLFTQKTETDGVPIEATQGLWDVIHLSEDELQMFECQQIYEKHEIKEKVKEETSLNSADVRVLPTYTEAVQQLPIGFYFPSDTGIILSSEVNSEVKFLGQTMSKYDPSSSLPKAYRRPQHDNFRPPNGPPIFSPVSIGYGPEVGLEPGLQVLWNPNLKTYFFIDHIRKITFYNDPRPPPDPKPVVKKQDIVYGDGKFQPVGSMPVRICRDIDVIEATTHRAHSKPHGCILYAGGNHGKHGSPGQTGRAGNPGAAGYPGAYGGGQGGQGGNGDPGGHGGDGERGGDATAASDVNICISGDSYNLCVDGTSTFTANLGGPRAEEVLFITCRGGDGGNGGRGGDGGKGGEGGRGGNGGKGTRGQDGGTGPGGDGGPGGNGGNGGNGGQGGNGGKGGDGGHAGNGGRCVIQTTFPELFMLVEADCYTGTKGKAGNGGSAGKGGAPGDGGDGGKGGRGGAGGGYRDENGTHHFSDGNRGRRGFGGGLGSRGSNGTPGKHGADGNAANHGGILWILSSSNGDILYESSTRYDAQISGFDVASAVDDGIFEPNERILVTGCRVLNIGGLPIPSGTTAFMPSTKTIKFEPTRYELPSDQMLPNQSFVIPITYYGRIFDQPPPNVPGPFVSSAEFHPRVELLGRPFEKSFHCKKLVVQYPVKLAYLKSSENLGRGEVSMLEIGVQNISTMPYGDSPGSGGRVFLQIHLDARLIPVGSANVNTSSVPYTITFDPNVRDSLYIQLHDIPAGQTVNVQVTIQMESRAELFDRCLWQADLHLRDKMIEYNFDKIRVTPFYIPQDPTADVLMITDNAITRKEFVFWQKVLQILDLSVDFWDVVRYNGISVDQATNARHKTSWEGRYSGKLIFYPHCRLEFLWGSDIVRHFHGPEYQDGPLKDFNSSMVLFLQDSQLKQRQSDEFHDKGDLFVLRHLAGASTAIDLPGRGYGGRHLFQPGTCSASSEPHRKWEKKQMKKMEKEAPQQSPIVYTRTVDIKRGNSFLTYNYGEIDIRRVPLLRSCKFVVYDGAGGNLASMISYDDLNVTPTSVEIPLASSYAQVFLMTMYGMSISKKINLLKPEQHQEKQQEDSSTLKLSFTLPNGYRMSLPELIMITFAWEVADEVYSNSGDESERMGEFAKGILESPALYAGNGRAIVRGLKLIQVEVRERKKKMKNAQVNRLVSSIDCQISQISCSLREQQVDTNNLKSLPSLKCLVDGSRVHYSHQHWVEDGRWNLPAQ